MQPLLWMDQYRCGFCFHLAWVPCSPGLRSTQLNIATNNAIRSYINPFSLILLTPFAFHGLICICSFLQGVALKLYCINYLSSSISQTTYTNVKRTAAWEVLLGPNVFWRVHTSPAQERSYEWFIINAAPTSKEPQELSSVSPIPGQRNKGLCCKYRIMSISLSSPAQASVQVEWWAESTEIAINNHTSCTLSRLHIREVNMKLNHQ